MTEVTESANRGDRENEASHKLCLARSLIDMMMNRFERQQDLLQTTFGGAPATDLHALMAIDELVEAAKGLIDQNSEVANA